MSAFLSACATLLVGVLGLVVALPLAEAKRSRSGLGFWQSYWQLSPAPLACATTGLAWAMYLDRAGDDSYTAWPPITAVVAAALTYCVARRR